MSKLVIKLKGKSDAWSEMYGIVLWGFVLRAVVLIIMLSIKSRVAPYFIADDISYEATAQRYLFGAAGVFDFPYLNRMLDDYIQPFWPMVLCLSAKLFGTIYAGRMINILLSTACIPVIYKTVLLLSGNAKTAKTAGKLFAFLPLPVLVCCFPIKDTFLTLTVLYAFYMFLLVSKEQHVGFFRLALCAVGLVCTYFTRGAVAELMLIFFFMLWINALIKEKRYIALCGVVLLAGVLLVFFGKDVLESFQTKIDDYSNQESQGALAMLQMTSITQIYKLPFAYAFATLQPMTLNYLGKSSSFWMWLMSFSNITMYPVAIANMLYVVCKKHNFLYWLCGLVMYCAIISMCLGIFRHYMFLLPLQIINCALCFDRKKPGMKQLVLLGSMGMVALVSLYSLLAFI